MLVRPIGIRICWILALAVGAGPAVATDQPEAMIPFDKLDAAALARVRHVVPGYTFYHKLRTPYGEFRARRDVFEYLGDHLDLSSILGQPLQVTKFRSERLPDGSIWADNHAGVRGYLWTLYVRPGERLFIVHGSDRSGDTVEGDAVVLVRYQETEPGLIHCEVHAFVKVKTFFRRFLAGLFLPLVTGTVNQRFGEVLSIPVLVSEEATQNPDKILATMDSLPPEDAAKLKEFRALLNHPQPQRP